MPTANTEQKNEHGPHSKLCVHETRDNNVQLITE